MGNGYWAGDAIATGLELAGLKARTTAQIKALNAEIENLEVANAGNLAEKHALRTALAKLAPKHPLIANLMLRDQIKKQGARAFSANRNWDDAARYGQTVKY